MTIIGLTCFSCCLFFHHTFSKSNLLFCLDFYAATAEDMALKRRAKRAPIPRINASDLEDENDDEVAAARKSARQVT